MKHRVHKSPSRLMVLAAAGLLALGLAGCNPDSTGSKGPGGPGGGVSKDSPSSSPMSPDKK